MAELINIKDASHILFRLLTKFKSVHGDYKSLVDGLHGYISTVPRNNLQVKVTTLIGNSEPSNPAGEAQRFLNTYFTGMNSGERVAYFYQNYFGGQIKYQTLLANMKDLDDAMRIKLTETPNFIIIGLTNRNAAGLYTDLYHITISRDINYDAQGQHGVPVGAEVLQSIHLTDETTGVHYFVNYNQFSSPLNESAATLLASLKPGRWGGKTIRRKKLRRSKKRGTSKTKVRR